MKKYNKYKEDLSCLKTNWAVAELEVQYKPVNKTGISVNSSEDAHNVFREMWDDTLINLQEQFCVLFLNTAGEVIAFRVINTGSLRESTMDLQFILVCALKCRSTSLILAHNHPSGHLKASTLDIEVTERIQLACNLLNLQLLDHLIISESGYLSFIDESLIPFGSSEKTSENH